jgi:hypothetical protein
MTRRLWVVGCVVAVMALGGCDGEKTHDVAWYKTHDAERLAKIQQCENDRGELEHAPNCQNAKKAAEELTFDSHNSKIPQL